MSDSPEAGVMSPLARLLRSKQSNGLPWREMERKALMAGWRYTAQAFMDVAKDKLQSRLSVDAIKAIAAAIDEDYNLIARLDDERWGIRHDGLESAGADSLRYQRPDGLTDEAWEKLKDENRAHMDYLIERAAKER